MEPRTNTHLNHIRPGARQVFRALRGGHVARHDGKMRIFGLDARNHIQHAAGLAVRRVQRDHIYLAAHQRGHALHGIARYAHGGGAEQAAIGVLGGIRVFGGLLNVLDGDQAAQHVVFIHQRQLFDAVLGQNLLGLGQRGAHGRGDEIFAGHHFVNGAGFIGFKAQIAVGEDAHQLAVFRDGHAGNAVALHQSQRVCHAVAGRKEKWIGDYAVFRALHLVHLRRLRGDGHILVDHANAAFARDGDAHAGVGHGVHGSGEQRYVQLDAFAKLCGKIHFFGKHLALLRHQEHIVKRKPFANWFHAQAPPAFV